MVTVDTKKNYNGTGETYFPADNFLDNIYNDLNKTHNFDENRNFGAKVNVTWNGRDYDVTVAYLGTKIQRKL